MKFQFGQWVEAQAGVTPTYDENSNRSLERDPFINPIRGRICGLSRKFTGTVIRPSPEGFLYNELQRPYLDIKGTIQLWQIKIGWLNKPISIMEEDLKIIEDQGELPLLSYVPSKISDYRKDHEYLLEKEKNW